MIQPRASGLRTADVRIRGAAEARSAAIERRFQATMPVEELLDGEDGVADILVQRGFHSLPRCVPFVGEPERMREVDVGRKAIAQLEARVADVLTECLEGEERPVNLKTTAPSSTIGRYPSSRSICAIASTTTALIGRTVRRAASAPAPGPR